METLKRIAATIAAIQSQYAHQANELPLRPIFGRSKKEMAFLPRAITAMYSAIAPKNAVVVRIRKTAAMAIEAAGAL